MENDLLDCTGECIVDVGGLDGSACCKYQQPEVRLKPKRLRGKSLSF